MDHSKFIRMVVDSGLVASPRWYWFCDSSLTYWLTHNALDTNPKDACGRCAHLEKASKGKFSERVCAQNVAEGGSCYRQVLATKFIPFLENALRGEYPTVDELQEVVHKRGPHWDGVVEGTLLSLILHEVGGAYLLACAEARTTQMQTAP